MMTFYIVGCIIAFMLLSTAVARMIVTKEIDDSGVMIDILITVLVSLLSWAMVFIIIMISIFRLIEKNRKDKQ